jgi:DNA polymerase-1
MVAYETMLEERNDETARKVLEYRGWQKTCSSNYQSYLSLVSLDGRVRPNYRLHGTVTGRLSCSDPNLQQIPRTSDKPWNGNLKKAFIPKDGYSLYEADYSQLELRLAATYGQETELIEIFEEGRDVFTEMSQVLGMSRFNTKTLVYSMQYGAGINRISTVFGVGKSEAEDIRQNFYNQYPGFRAISRRATTMARSKGKVKLWSGRYRHFDRPDEQAHKAFNAVCQGGAADIVMYTMLRLEDEVDNAQECRMLLQVHDSVVYEIRNDKIEHYLPEIKRVMEAVVPNFGVKFAVEIKKWDE